MNKLLMCAVTLLMPATSSILTVTSVTTALTLVTVSPAPPKPAAWHQTQRGRNPPHATRNANAPQERGEEWGGLEVKRAKSKGLHLA